MPIVQLKRAVVAPYMFWYNVWLMNVNLALAMVSTATKKECQILKFERKQHENIRKP